MQSGFVARIICRVPKLPGTIGFQFQCRIIRVSNVENFTRPFNVHGVSHCTVRRMRRRKCIWLRPKLPIKSDIHQRIPTHRASPTAHSPALRSGEKNAQREDPGKSWSATKYRIGYQMTLQSPKELVFHSNNRFRQISMFSACYRITFQEKLLAFSANMTELIDWLIDWFASSIDWFDLLLALIDWFARCIDWFDWLGASIDCLIELVWRRTIN